MRVLIIILLLSGIALYGHSQLPEEYQVKELNAMIENGLQQLSQLSFLNPQEPTQAAQLQPLPESQMQVIIEVFAPEMQKVSNQ